MSRAILRNILNFKALVSAGLAVMIGCTPTPDSPQAKPEVPQVELTPVMLQMHAAITRDYRPVLARNCSPNEMQVVEDAWRFQTYQMFAKTSLGKAAAAAQVEAGRRNTIAAINALSVKCSRTYWRHQ